ncbi:hypothetical protein SAMN05421770_10755 [Granulicella rosea]|uniref:PH domain-containing protein n=1 Tax=Granulicella rosea TaxID=474952 RepID=A0A239LIY7_9BACT|nr:hypothetical protein [Granulicella rosea]SNT30250.1 hypothetical protein SAMN05421770_10755 [Granulicella rosea]
MNWLGPSARVERFEADGELRFQARNQLNGIMLLFPCISGLSFFYSLLHGEYRYAAVSAVAFVSALLGLFPTKKTLWVSGKGVETSSDLFDSASHRSFRWSEICALKYSLGAEDDPSGLYIRTGRWSETCVLAGVDEAQANEIIEAIFERFPNIELADEPKPLFGNLLGQESEFIRLGLSGHGEGPQST